MTTTTTSKSKNRRRSEKLAVINVSPSLEILEGLDIHNTFAAIEERLDSMEIDLAREHGSREDDARRMTGELAVMKARVEDALDAFAQTAGELREMAKGLDRRVGKTKAPSSAAVASLRQELEARIDGATAGIGDVLETIATDLGDRVAELTASLRDMQGSIESVSSAVDGLASLPRRLADLEEAVAEVRSRKK